MVPFSFNENNASISKNLKIFPSGVRSLDNEKLHNVSIGIVSSMLKDPPLSSNALHNFSGRSAFAAHCAERESNATSIVGPSRFLRTDGVSWFKGCDSDESKVMGTKAPKTSNNDYKYKDSLAEEYADDSKGDKHGKYDKDDNEPKDDKDLTTNKIQDLLNWEIGCLPK